MKKLSAVTLSLSLALAGVLGEAGCSVDHGGTGSRTTVLSTKPSLYLRVTPDGDAADIIGAFVPDDVPDAAVDETSAVRTRCSKYITPKRLPASGQYNDIAAASAGASGKLGVRSIAKVDLGGQSTDALLVRYALIEKMQADVDEDGLARCCSEAPDQCTKRYIATALLADGNYYAATESGARGGVDVEALRVARMPIDAEVVFDADMKWERQVDFKRQYFAFSVRRSLAGGQLSGASVDEAASAGNSCAWANAVPTDLDGLYFVGVSNPMPSEKLAREDAMRDARDQVIKYLGEFLSESQQAVQKTVGSVADLQVLMDDTGVKESVSGGVARAVKDRKWCGPTEQAAPSGMKSVMKVLAYFPHSERHIASVVALKTMIQKQKEAKKDTAALEHMLAQMEAHREGQR
jgi:hypothetical protein